MQSFLRATRALVVFALSASVVAAPLVVNVRSYGAAGDGQADDSASLQRAIEALNAAGGGELYFPAGTYLHSEEITVSGHVKVYGTGSASVLKALAPARAALVFMNATQCGAEDLRFVTEAKTRLHEQNSAALVMDHAENCFIRNISIEGSASVGILIANSHGVAISGNHIEDTLADGIHVVNGSADVIVENNSASNTGDDSFSAVAYASWPKQTDNVVISGNTSISSHARGVACIGASHCGIFNNTIRNPRGHGIAVAYESTYDTYRPFGARLKGNRIATVNPSKGTNSVLVSGARDVEMESTAIDGGNPVLVSDSSGIVVRNLVVNEQVGAPILERGHVQMKIEGVSANGNALAGGVSIVRKIQ
ncbi:glycosyl hydrolase family 28-related protein [Paraburkholderia sp. J76]|uniref:glycosyl hydrolase family 28-related protein n=1 Tax=Paraburkholderia sp. J76 TaxID=2805439 RepID=UPI002ABE9807|nr:glycosyl hydrolase family 28-related protein [Paraburkholderia sp. J76]